MKSHKIFSSSHLFAILRIAFGFVWAIDAWFKWQPAFLDGLPGYLTSAAQGQPGWIVAWINLWLGLVNTNPHLFAVIIALAETAIALGLLFGFMTDIAIYAGIVLSLAIWSVAEGFGGPYLSGSTDIGCAIIYAFMFVALLIGESAKTWSVDAWIKNLA